MDAKEKAARRIDELREQLRRHDYLYFVENNPEISDEQYDRLMLELRRLEQEHPDLITPDSPSQRVGERPLPGFAQVRHAVPMLSIDNTYDEGELREFDARIRRLLDEPYDYFVDEKIDGVAVSLRYEDGRLVLGATRGDGETGDDITQNVRVIRSVPLRLSGKGYPQVFEVRGEIYWPREEFERFNAEREKRGEERFKNPRNATAGTLKQLDPRNVAGRGLAFQAHSVGVMEPFPPRVERQSELWRLVRSWGVPVSRDARVCKDIDAVVAFIREWDQKRRRLPYETDGLVIKVDQLFLRDRLGATSKSPRWCVAYKYAAEQAQTRLLSVDFQVGKAGTITPVANLEPVFLAGTTVKRASLHNPWHMNDRLGLREGDTVVIHKAGEIIPEVIDVVEALRKPGAKPIRLPRECPSCGEPLSFDRAAPGERIFRCRNRSCEDGFRAIVRKTPGRLCGTCGEPLEEMDHLPTLRCNNPECPAQHIEKLIFFCGRDQMDIASLGEVVVQKLVDEGLVKSYADIYRLPRHADRIAAMTMEQTRSIKGETKTIDVPFGELRTRKLLEGVEASKKQPLDRLLTALNIRLVGSSTARDLAEHFGDIDALAAASVEELQRVEGVGPEVASSIHEWFHSRGGKRTIAELREVGVNMTQPRRAAPAGGGKLAGMSVVVTGTLKHYSRKEIEDLIRAHGGKAAGSVSSKTDLLVAGEEAGSKLEKARELGVKVVDEAAFRRMIGEE